jgi:hypothetical protein
VATTYRVISETVSEGLRIFRLVAEDGSRLVRSFPADDPPALHTGRRYTLEEIGMLLGVREEPDDAGEAATGSSEPEPTIA